ncbi:unnamed protein product, partial [Discosporangium mesarthrocarpum]
ESDVVIVSLVRSNDRGDMGFVCEPNRLNVTISRARYGRTFLNDITILLSDNRVEDSLCDVNF